ncbi:MULTISPECIES: hypothetical protein [unclassified Microcoleus]|uniref:hypothetical protein n=1 Tax=unclassified Microcoleus TaxID=2642155 RepID=UPI002FCFFE32
MTNYINTMELDELTHDFLSSLPSHTHMSWTEWQKEAEAYGLNENEIAELQQYLEVNKQLTSPMRFAGRQWWLTKQEIEHVELIKQYFPSNWEDEVLDRMQRGDLGYLNKDWRLKERKQTKRVKQQ